MEKAELDPTEKHQINERLVAAIFGEGISCHPYIYKEKEEGEEGEIVEITIDDKIYEARKVFLDKEIQAVLATLTERERRLVELRFGLEGGKYRTYKEITQEIGVPILKQSISYTLKRAFRKLRHPSRSRRLREFFIPTPEDRFEAKLIQRERIERLERWGEGLKDENRQLREEKEELEIRLRKLGLEIKTSIKEIKETPIEKLPTLEELTQDEKALEKAFEAVAARYPRVYKPSPHPPFRRVAIPHLPTLVWNALRRNGIFRLSQLKEVVETNQKIRHIGVKGWKFIQEVLQEAEQKAPP